MKVRIEPEGIHYYCRKSGVHILLDEVSTKPSLYSKAPRTVSIAITDECDFSCSYCYVKLKDRYLEKETVVALCKEFDSFGTFDVAFGGGEPTLHPDLVDICKLIWENTGLGISITTHGHHLSKEYIAQLKNYVSFLRISIDGIDPIYSQLRKKPFEKILQTLADLSGQIPFGINTVVNKLTVYHLDDIKELFKMYKAFELLLLPMWHKGKYVLGDKEWSVLNDWIKINHKEIPIRISAEAKMFLDLPFLFDHTGWDNDYAFVGIDKTLRINSFTNDGLAIENYQNFEELLNDHKRRVLAPYSL